MATIVRNKQDICVVLMHLIMQILSTLILFNIKSSDLKVLAPLTGKMWAQLVEMGIVVVLG